jgi:hypothetical protein
MQQQRKRGSEDGETKHSLVDAGGGLDDDLTPPPNQARPHVPHKTARLARGSPDTVPLGVELQRPSLHLPEAQNDVRRRAANVELRQGHFGLEAETVRDVRVHPAISPAPGHPGSRR